MMMSLCRTLLGFPDHDDRGRSIHRRRGCGAAPSDAAGLRCVAAEIIAPPAHVVESAAVGPRAPVSSAVSPPLMKKAGEEEEEEKKKIEKRMKKAEEEEEKKKKIEKRMVEWIDDGTRGLSYLYGRDGGGRLELCTESLGFESCCDGRMGVEEERAEQEIRRRIEEAYRGSTPDGKQGDGASRRKARPARSRTERKEFPPPLTWMSGGDGGRPRSFLKAVRKDGRFLLKEVQIERPEVFRASRQCGRLRLELVKREPQAADGEEEAADLDEVVMEKAPVMEPEAVAEEAVEEEPRWLLPSAKAFERTEGGGGGGFRSGRCQELARERLPSSPFWGSPYLTTA